MTQQHNPVLQLALQQAMRDKPKRQQVKEATDLMYKRFAVLRQFRPLAIGIHEDAIAALPQFDPVVVQRVIQRHCSTARYLKGMMRDGFRYKLDGKRAAELSEAEKDDAKRRLDLMAAAKTDEAAPVVAGEAVAEAAADAADIEVAADGLSRDAAVSALGEVKEELGEIVKLLDGEEPKPAA